MNALRWPLLGCVALVIALFLATFPARAVIMRLTPLEEVLKEGQYIFTAKVDRLDPDKPSAVLEVDEHLKGKAPFARLPINLTGDSEAKKFNHTPQLLKRLAPKLPLVVFVIKQNKQYIGFGYTNGTWFQMTAQDRGSGDPVWSFAHCEPYLRRTFKGTTAEMRQTVIDGLSGKKAPPKPNEKEPPGLGPEVKEDPKTQSQVDPKRKPSEVSLSGTGPLFAVIPSVAIGGVLSLLAMLFPAVFGGLTGQLKRWMAAISVISLNSTLLFLHDWFAPSLQGTRWGTPTALWVTMTGVTLLGMLWAWRRHFGVLTGPADPPPTPPPTFPSLTGFAPAPPGTRTTVIPASVTERLAFYVPGRQEHLFLWVLSGLGLGLVVVCLLMRYPLLTLPWSFVLVMWVGIWTSTLYVALLRWRAGRPRSQPPLTSEGVMLWAMVPACLAFGLSATPGMGGQAAAAAESGVVVAGSGSDRAARFVGEMWTFVPDGQGYLASSPLVDGDRVYAAVAHGSAFRPFGKLYCVERATGKKLWEFNDDGAMKQCFSSPCLADGRLYIGEGFHQDFDCKLYCLDAKTGKKLWDFTTTSHTESSPVVAGGKVFFGAGDDGVYCLDAETGKELWHFNDGLHVDSNPAVVGNRLYAGAGVGDVHKKLELFCLDTETGQPVWRVPADLPVWGSPTVFGEHVFFGLGNGNFLFSDEKPAGALMCVQAKDGRRVWQYDVRDGVLCRPAVDRQHVYFGSRDGLVYCLDRREGRLRWKQDMGSPVVASSALVRCRCCPASTSLYVIGTAGRVCCLNPTTGEAQWTFDLTKTAAQMLSSPAVVVYQTDDGERRRIFFGAGLNGLTTAVLYCLEDEWK